MPKGILVGGGGGREGGDTGDMFWQNFVTSQEFFFFFGVRYGNVERNHTHTHKEKWIMTWNASNTYIYIKKTLFSSFLFSFFERY